MSRFQRSTDPPASFERIHAPVLLVTGLVLAAGCAEPPPDPASKPPIETRRTVGKTTQTVLDLAAALAEGGVVIDPAAPREGMDIVTGAHRAMSAQVASLAVEQALKLDAVEHQSRPRTHAQFMARIIRPGDPDGLRLPMLPYDQEYAFDPQQGALVVVDFPARREQRHRETTGAAGF